MKTKLLKIIRKRYEINYVTNITNVNHIFYNKDNLIPYYELKDNKGNHIFDTYHRTKESALSMLSKWIKEDYQHKIKGNGIVVSVKVWWVKK